MVVGVIVAPIGAHAASKPTGLSPNDPGAAPTSSGVGTPRKNVELRWNPVSGASSYEVQITGVDGKFASPAVSETVQVPRFAVPSTLPRGDWGWRVRVAGGPWSGTAYFRTGWASSPGTPRVVGSTVDARGPVLTWDALPDASFYEVQLSPEPFNRTPYDEGGVPLDPDEPDASFCYTQSTVLTPYVERELASTAAGEGGGSSEDVSYHCTELSGGPFYWRVRARDGQLDPRSTNAPAPGAACTGPWYKEQTHFSVQVSDCSAWAYPTVPSFTVNHAAHLDPTLTAPGVPTGLDVGPRDGANTDPVTVTNTPVFRWNAVPNAAFYRVYQSRTPDLDTLDHVWETPGTALAVIDQDPDWANRIYWSVQACAVSELDTDGFLLNYRDIEGNQVQCGHPSQPRMYVKKTPARVQPVSTTSSGGATTLTWSTLLDSGKPNGSLQARVTDAKGYQLQVSGPNGDFTRPSTDLFVDRLGTTAGRSHWTVPTRSLPPGWTWRVRAFDETGNAYAWSDSPPKAPIPPATPTSTLSVVKRPGPASPFTVRFSEAVKGVSASSLRLQSQTGGLLPGTTVRKVNARTWEVRPGKSWVAGERYRVHMTSAVKSASSGLTVVPPAQSWRRAKGKVDSASTLLQRRKTERKWKQRRASDAMGKSFLLNKPKKRKNSSGASYVEARVRGAKVQVFACRTPNSGRVDVLVDGRRRTTVNLYQRYSSCGRVKTVKLDPSKAQTVRFRPTGTKVKRSKGRTVRFDGFRVK